MPIVVQKFGGTSVATEERRAAVIERILEAKENNYGVVVVVSAMGRTGEPYATDTLINLLHDTDDKSNQRDLDLVMSCGEVIAAGVLASQLRQSVGKVTVLTGWQAGVITDERHGDARVISVRTERIRQLLVAGHIVLVTGFQGLSEAGEVTTLGRGGSDTTAAALGVALSAEKVEIYTDVDGIMTADPRMVEEARVLDVLDYSEVLQLAYEGARVIHPRAVELAMRQNVPLLIKHHDGRSAGTLITAAALYERRRKVRPVTGVAHLTGIAQLIIRPSTRGTDCFNHELFAALTRHGVSVDLINICPHLKMMTVQERDIPAAERAVAELSVAAEIRPGCAKVSVVGIGMRRVPGVMATIARALHEAGVEILQTGDSHLHISCLIRKEDIAQAMSALHRHFELETEVN